MSLTTLGAELRRTLRLAHSYWLQYVSDFMLYSSGFLVFVVVLRAATDTYGPQGYLSTLIGYTIWIICATVTSSIARAVVQEARTGTLEQLFLTGRRPGLILLGRSVGLFFDYGARGLLMGGVLAAGLGVLRPLPPLAVLAFGLTALGAGGLGFTLAGLALVHKQVEGLITLTWQMLVFFTGALAPLTHPVLALLAKLLPLSWGIASLRAMLVHGAGSESLWRSGELPGLLLNTAFYVTLGAALFAWGQKRARTLGTLGHY
jgi:ABC-2 type transport system permease protein